MINKLFLLFSLFLICISSLQGYAQQVSHQALFEKAKRDYYQNEFTEAEKRFVALLEKTGPNGVVYYNLGNVYFQQKEFGKSLLYYEKAKKYLPREKKLQHNLALVQQQVSQYESQSLKDYLLRTFYFWNSWLRLYELQLILLFVSLLFWGYLISQLWRKKSILRMSSLFLAILYFYCLGGFYLKFENDWLEKYGVVISKQAPLQASFLEGEQVLIEIAEGTRLEVLDVQKFETKEDWYKVELPQGQIGWVRSDYIGII